MMEETKCDAVESSGEQWRAVESSGEPPLQSEDVCRTELDKHHPDRGGDQMETC